MTNIYLNRVPTDCGDKPKEGEMSTTENSFLYRGRSQLSGRKMEPARFTLG